MDSKIKGLFISYLEKTISAKEEKDLLDWLKNNPRSLDEYRKMFRVWNVTELLGGIRSGDVEKEWIILLQRAASQKRSFKNSVTLLGYWLPRAAAVFLLGAVVAFAISYQLYNFKQKELVYHEVSSPAGAKSKITLPDGSSIWLNAGSTIKYSNRYGKSNRQVDLTGEAFFEVKTNTSKVFVVKTADLDIKAYGTAFNVKSYPEENRVEATLVEGSIGVTRTKFNKKKKDEVILEPNQRVVYYKPNQDLNPLTEAQTPKAPEEPAEKLVKRESQKLTYMISKGIDTEPFTAWKEGVLVIKSETLEELAVKLERKYDVSIQFDDTDIKAYKFTGLLENETIEQVMMAIGIAAQIDYSIDEREIRIKKPDIK